jgi:hypothetical protein
MEWLIEHVRARPAATELVTSCKEGDGSPPGFYRRLGFELNARRYGGELGLSLILTGLPRGVEASDTRPAH